MTSGAFPVQPMKRKIYLVGTADTKGEELAYLAGLFDTIAAMVEWTTDRTLSRQPYSSIQTCIGLDPRLHQM